LIVDTGKPDVICITETWLKNDELAFYNIVNYNLYYAMKTTGEEGGALFMLKDPGRRVIITVLKKIIVLYLLNWKDREGFVMYFVFIILALQIVINSWMNWKILLLGWIAEMFIYWGISI